MIWALQKYWKPDYELVLANALASMIANDCDQAVMESCAEVIGHAYEENTPLPDQIRLKELLYGDKEGNIGVVLRTENLIWDRDQESLPAHDPNESVFKRAQEAQKADRNNFNMRIRYICEAVRKNWENLREANFEKTLLAGILLYRAKAQNANFHAAILSGGRLFETRFDGANMREAHLEGANLWRAALIDAHLEGAYLGDPDAEEVLRAPDHLIHTDLREARLDNAHLRGADLTNADLTGATLDGADLTDACLDGARVTRAALARSKGNYKGIPISPEGIPILPEESHGQ